MTIAHQAKSLALAGILGTILVGCATTHNEAEDTSAIEAVTATEQAQNKVSAPNQYEGFSEAKYDGFEQSSFYVPMRDGTKLAVDLFRPTKDGVLADEKLPVIWMHTPYQRRGYRGGLAAETYPGYALKLAPYGYNVALVDFRGVYASYGQNIAYNRGEWIEAARFDAYDVTEWFAAQPYSNGKIGMWGCSATGGSQMQALTTRPPSLKAVIPMSAEFDVYSFTTLGGVSALRPIAPPGQDGGNAAVARRDAMASPVDGPQADAQLKEAIASHADNIESVGVVPFRDSISEATGLEWWKVSSPHTYADELKQAEIGVLSVANWDEAGTRHGPFFTFNNLNPAYTKLLAGPSTHCAWSTVKEETGFDLVTEERRFFDYWLKDIDNGVMEEPAVTYYTYNAPADSAWRTSETWPLQNEKPTPMYFSANGGLQNDAADSGKVEVALSTPPLAQTITIAAADGGTIFETEPLTESIEVTGHPLVSLWVATQADDVDASAHLIDVAPDGTTKSYQMLGRLRASHRQTAEAPYNHLGLPWRTHKQADVIPLEAGTPTELTFDMLPMSYLFKEGHKIRVHVTFSHPTQKAQGPAVEILTGGDHASQITLPVIPQE